MAELIPRPVRQTYTDGLLRWSDLGPIEAPEFDREQLKAITALLARALSATPVASADADRGQLRIELVIDPELEQQPVIGVAPFDQSNEGYRLEVGLHGVRCSAGTRLGAIRAVGTLAQLLCARGPLRHQLTEDHPRFAWRGFMVDVARSFRTLEELHELIDLCALYKLNVLHLHLTDHAAWRIEIPGMPELTSVQATVGAGPGQYTLREFEQLQLYAELRGVTIVPEIDLPGHCDAVMRALPWLAQQPRPAGLDPAVPFVAPLDLSDEHTRNVVERVISAVAGATRGRFLHFGGDEATGAGEEESYAVSIRHLREIVRATGKQPLAWQEAARAGVDADQILQHWICEGMNELPDGEDVPSELQERAELVEADMTWGGEARALKSHFAKAAGDVPAAVAGGAKVLLSTQSHLYLDRPFELSIVPVQQKTTAERLGFLHYRRHRLEAMLDWDPLEQGVPVESIAGIEAAVWGESITCFSDVLTLALPRLLAVAEGAWSPEPAAWDELHPRLATHAPLWRAQEWRYLASTEVDWL